MTEIIEVHDGLEELEATETDQKNGYRGTTVPDNGMDVVTTGGPPEPPEDDADGAPPERLPSLLRQLVDLRDRQIQKARIQFTLRLSAIERGQDIASKQQTEMLLKWQSTFDELELKLNSDIAKLVQTYPIFKEVSKLKGIGPMLSAKMIAMIDIEMCDTTSALWRYAGYATIDGQRERRVAGEKSHFNGRLKTTTYLVALSFLRCNSPYRRVYDDAKAYYAGNRPEWTKGHIHMASLRKMIKVFLNHFWLRWRQIENLPTPDLWITGRADEAGHVHEKVFRPEEFGWPV